MSRLIDRTKPPFRDDPVLARLTDDEAWAVGELLARLATSFARRMQASAEQDDDDASAEVA